MVLQYSPAFCVGFLLFGFLDRLYLLSDNNTETVSETIVGIIALFIILLYSILYCRHRIDLLCTGEY